MDNSVPRKYAVYGLGRAARSLCLSLHRAFGDLELLVYSRTVDTSREEFARALNIQLLCDEGVFFRVLKERRPQILFIATPDDTLHSVGKRIAMFEGLPQTIAHLSGNRWQDELGKFPNNTQSAQFHPLASLTGVSPIPGGTLLGVGCENQDVKCELESLAQSIGCLPVALNQSTLNLYHSAAVISGNLPLALLSMSLSLFEHCGIDKELARKSLANLMKSAAERAMEIDLDKALTGPIARRDIKTLKMHIEALSDNAVPEAIATTYRQLSLQLLKEKRFTLNEKKGLESLFEDKPCGK